MNKLYALLSSLVLGAGIATSAYAQSPTVQGYFYNKHSNQIMLVEGDVLKAYPYSAQRLPAALWQFTENADGSASLLNVLTQRYAGKVAGFNQPTTTQTEEFSYKLSSELGSDGFTYYSFADTTTAGTQVWLHNNNNNNVVRWNAGTGPDASAPSRWYFVPEGRMEAFASLQNNKLMLKQLAKDVLDATMPAYSKVNTPLITNENQLSTNSQEPSEGPIKNLIDNDETTFFHSTWSKAHPRIAHIAVTIENGAGQKTFQVDYKKRQGNNYNIPTKIAIYGGIKQADGTIQWEAQPFTTLENPGHTTETNYEGVGAYGGHFQFTADKVYTAFRFDVLKTNTSSDFFTYSEFQLFPTEVKGPKPRVVRHQFLQQASQFWSNMKEPSEGSYADLLDGNNKTFFHSAWKKQGNVDHYLAFKFDNPDGVTEFKMGYNARNTYDTYNDRPTEIDIYGGTANGNDYQWTKITTAKAPAGDLNRTNVKGIGGISGVLDIDTNNKVYTALKLVVKKTTSRQRYFTYGDLQLYTEKRYPAGITVATEAQAIALNKALAQAEQNLLPYVGGAEAIENDLRKALNDIVPNIIELSTKQKALSARLNAALNRADDALEKAGDAIRKSPFSTKALQKVADETNETADAYSRYTQSLEYIYNQIVGGYEPYELAEINSFFENLGYGVDTLNLVTKDLEDQLAAFVDPDSRWKLVPIEPWMNVDYAVHWDKKTNLTVTRHDRYSLGYRVISSQGTQEFLTAQHPENVYNEQLTDTVVVNLGEEIRVEPNYNNNWMHAYVFIDANQDKKFAWENLTPGTTNGELVSYNYYQGKNSLGETVSNPSKRDNAFFVLPAFAAPQKAGNYRVRVKIDWNNIDPAGQYNGLYTNNFIDKNGGYIYDFTLRVVDPTHVGVAPLAPSVDAPAFDLSGRRVNGKSKGRIIIVNGKKQMQ